LQTEGNFFAQTVFEHTFSFLFVAIFKQQSGLKAQQLANQHAENDLRNGVNVYSSRLGLNFERVEGEPT
jgi:hypothetical protein